MDRFAPLLRRTGRLFTIRTRIEAYLVIYALALGAADRGAHYLARFPGTGGALLFLACLAAVAMAGGRILDALRYEDERKGSVSQPLVPPV
jgi:hypothetical protein